jgi:hypothetical protein
MHSEDSDAPNEYLFDGFVVNDDEAAPVLAHSSRVDVDVKNIITGKRKRRATQTIYDDPEFAVAFAEQMMSDIPETERTAALDDECDDAIILTDDETDDDLPASDEDPPAEGDPPAAPAASVPTTAPAASVPTTAPAASVPTTAPAASVPTAAPADGVSSDPPVRAMPKRDECVDTTGSDDEDYNPSGTSSESDVELDELDSD